jgi:signal transduction histidine kinase
LREIRQLAQQVEDQARLLHQDKMISLGKLAASVVHEINNPVAGVLNYTRLMMKVLTRGPLAPGTPDRFKGYLSLMESELTRCSKIISNLLAFSRKSDLEFGIVSINDLLGRCIMLAEHRLSLQNIRVQVKLEEDLPKITGDFSQLQQCIINLIFNAVDAMPTGGTLTIEGAYERVSKMIEIKVADTGSGIARENLPFIFDPFFTTKTEGKGLGLGLSTVYGIIGRHRGTITAKSNPGEETVFTIRLPNDTRETLAEKPSGVEPRFR